MLGNEGIKFEILIFPSVVRLEIFDSPVPQIFNQNLVFLNMLNTSLLVFRKRTSHHLEQSSKNDEVFGSSVQFDAYGATY